MAGGDTCGFKTTNEELIVYVGLTDDRKYNEETDNFELSGKRIVGIYNRLQDCKTAKRWNNGLKYFEKCKISIEKIDDVEVK
jgi:hypothetical protein